MRKLIAAINMTVDGYCDHTVIIPDLEIHQHYANLLYNANAVIYGRVTYQLMEYWRTVVKNPTGIKSTDEFAIAIDKIPKIVFSRTLKKVDWETARLANQDIEKEILDLKQSGGGRNGDILVCSPGMIVTLANLNLVDEFQLCIHPVIAGSGLPLFKNIREKMTLKLVKTKTFGFGAVTHFYAPAMYETIAEG